MNYYRQGNILSNLPQVTRVILIINIALFVIDFLFKARGLYLGSALALWSLDSGNFKPYQIITHMFMHGNLLHILFNMYFGLFMFGRYLENTMGAKKYFILYFASGLGAAALQLGVYALSGEVGAMVGASGAIMGIVAAFAVYYPNVQLMLLFPPIPIKAKYMLPIIIGLSLLLGVTGSGGNIAHFAHLGGAVTGFIITRFWTKNQFKQF